MRRGHVVAAALLIGVGAAFGTYAATRTSELGAGSRAASKKAVDATVAAQTRRLDALETSLRKALAGRPPTLPKIPKLLPAPRTSTRVIYSAAPTGTVAPVSGARSTVPPASHGEQKHRLSSSGGEYDD
jgi:hypothetical protein